MQTPEPWADKQETEEMMPQPRWRVLVVEDDEAVRAPLEKFLRLHCFGVESATTADEALALVARHAPDAAIIDLRLPQGSGRDVVVAIPPPVPVVIFSGAPYDSDGLERLRPHTRVILKPFSLVMLVETVKKMLGEAG